MTEQEYQILAQRIVGLIKSASKTIAELPRETSISDGDLIELSGGRSVSFNTLRKALLSEGADDKYISATHADTANGVITFIKGLVSEFLAKFHGGAEFGEFVKSMTAGSGAGIDSSGNAQFESVEVRSYMLVAELILNRLSAVESDYVFNDSGTIEKAEPMSDGTWRLTLRKRWDYDFTAFQEYDIIYGSVNTLLSDGSYRTSWMRVNSVNRYANQINVTLYPHGDVPAGQNFPPCEGMNVLHRGNAVNEERQSAWYLSSREGRIVYLKGVDHPMVGEPNVALSLGSIPEFVYNYLFGQGKPVTEKDDILFADAIAVRNLYYYPKGDGTCEIEYVDRGLWQSGGQYYHKAPGTLTNGKWEVSDVWHFGCKWRCMSNLTADEPKWNSTAWAMIEGNSNFRIDFREPFQLYDPDNFAAQLSIVANIGYMDVTNDIDDADVQWTRRSWDRNGSERVAADTIWALSKAGSGKQLSLSIADIGVDAGGWPKRIEITATATLRDGMQAQAVFAYPLND